MDIPNTIIGTIFFLVLIAPIVIVNKRILKRRQQFVNKINEFAAEDQKKVIEFDTWTDNTIIGISDDNQMLYFLRNTADYNLKTKVAISDIKYCFIKEDKESNRINALEFVIELNSSKDSIVLEFFKVDNKNFIIGEEMRIAKKWNTKLVEGIPKSKVLLYSF
ncbi:hypothetical protein FLGE108171_00310 [Flavobacterium gelidilacus]|jgi:hypothetical protein|uniref:hypothetical protein n=1 Tax=Flavobacterium gelidilacus TaxID=206041 RepID=UPI0003F93551|nr:hypothetical protein [Flavobacterium gelidilacus]